MQKFKIVFISFFDNANNINLNLFNEDKDMEICQIIPKDENKQHGNIKTITFEKDAETKNLIFGFSDNSFIHTENIIYVVFPTKEISGNILKTMLLISKIADIKNYIIQIKPCTFEGKLKREIFNENMQLYNELNIAPTIIDSENLINNSLERKTFNDLFNMQYDFIRQEINKIIK